jgi:hypothetical protein
MLEFPLDEPERLGRHVGVSVRAEQLVTSEERPDEARLVVQHLLEVRDDPLAVGAVAVEAAAEVVVESARGHRVERLAGDGAVGVRVFAGRGAQE